MVHPNIHGQWPNALGRHWLRRRLVFALKPKTGLTLPGLGKRHLFRWCDSVIRNHCIDPIRFGGIKFREVVTPTGFFVVGWPGPLELS